MNGMVYLLLKVVCCFFFAFDLFFTEREVYNLFRLQFPGYKGCRLQVRPNLGLGIAHM